MPKMLDQNRLDEELVRRVFPSIRFDSDPDIERYFELRKSGMQFQALALYKLVLCKRYPDSDRRVRLIRAFRSSPSEYAALLRESMLSYAERMVRRVYVALDALSQPLAGFDPDNTYDAIVRVESIIKRLPPDAHDAMAALERLLDLSSSFSYKESETRLAYDLVREYLAQSGLEESFDSYVERRREERSKAAKAREERASKGIFDLSKVRFSDEDVAKIVIPSSIERKEDKIVAYCFKYWPLALDPGFERTVFLYSRKYHSPHFDILHAVKAGRTGRLSDEEMLNAVSTILSTGYSYSVRGDLYLQSAWRYMRARLAKPAEPPVEVPSETMHEAQAEPLPRQTQKKPTRLVKVHKGLAALKKPRLASNIDREDDVSFAPSEKSPVVIGRETLVNEDRTKRGEGFASPTTSPLPPKRPSRGSISDMIKRLSGRSYDVYREAFLERLRHHIRHALAECSSRPHALFGETMNEAEDAIYGFMQTNYNNPFMDWEGSSARARCRELGFEIQSLDDLVERCYRSL